MRDFRVDEPEIEEFIEHWRRLIASKCTFKYGRTPRHIIPYHTVSYYMTSCWIISHYIILHHIIYNAVNITPSTLTAGMSLNNVRASYSLSYLSSIFTTSLPLVITLLVLNAIHPLPPPPFPTPSYPIRLLDVEKCNARGLTATARPVRNRGECTQTTRYRQIALSTIHRNSSSPQPYVSMYAHTANPV